MLQIAVCDDEPRVLGLVEKAIYTYCESKNIKLKVSFFSDGCELLKSNEKFDIIFLDIEMKHSNGIKIAEKIREIDMIVPIVYITSYVDYWRRAFKVHAFGFIVKPFIDDDINKILDDYFISKNDSNEELITFTTNDGLVCFKPKDIYYFTLYSKKKVHVYTCTGKTIVRENISDIYNKLDKTQFYKSRRDCIVNLKYVKKLQNKFIIVMTNGDMLPLAQKKREEFMTKLSTEFIIKLKGENYE